jgi:hypothetical protein
MTFAKGVVRALFVAAAVVGTAQCTKLPYEPVQILVLDVSTQGSEVDGDGYLATIDDEMSQSVAANGSVTFEGLGAGERLLTISGLAGNCAVDGPNPRPVTVEEDAITRASVNVTCSPVAGLLIVEVGTTGTELDADGYTVTVDGTVTQTIGSNGSVTFEGLTPGEHLVSLENIADNCGLLDEEPNPRSVILSANLATATEFQVQCGPRGGSLVVVASTSGTNLDPDGYTISLDDSTPTPIETNGAITFTNLADGDHEITIDGLENNCTITEGSRSRTVTVTSNASASETFFVFCGPPAGALVVDVTTTGTDVDDGYVVSVIQTLTGQAVTKALTTNGSVTFEGQAAGEYLVQLSGVASNCAVVVDETPNPRTIVLAPGASSATSFFVHCQPVAGALVVDVSTRGSAPPAEGYSISVGGAAAKAIEPNGAVLFEKLLAGDRGVRVGDLPENCQVGGANPRTVRVAPGASTRASFEVLCDVDRTLTVKVTTSGADPRVERYQLFLDEGTPVWIDTTGDHTFADVLPGVRTVRIDGLPVHCSVTDGALVRRVTVGDEGTPPVEFSVNCRATPEDETGTLMVKPRTKGVRLGTYVIYLDESESKEVDPNGNAVFRDVAAGEHEVSIGGWEGCTLWERIPRTVQVPAGGIEVVWFNLTCPEES